MGSYTDDDIAADHSADLFRWANIDEVSNKEDIERLQNQIIEDGNAAFAYFFAVDFAYKTYLMQKVILDNNDAKYACAFAMNIKGADIKALRNVVIKSKKVKYINRFACFVKGANRKRLEALIIESKKPRYLFQLAQRLTSSKDIEKIEDLIIRSGSFTYMRLFAEDIASADVEKIEQAVLATDNSAEVKKFAKYVSKSKMKKFLLVG